MALFEKDVEEVVLNFIRRKSGEFKSDVQISELIEKDMDLVITHTAVCQLRRKHNIPSGQVAKNDKEREIAIKVWNQERTVQSVAEALNINIGSARSKLRILHGKGIIEASSLIKKRRTPSKKLSNEAKRLQQKKATLRSHTLVNEMRQRKMDRVAYLCDMRTL